MSCLGDPVRFFCAPNLRLRHLDFRTRSHDLYRQPLRALGELHARGLP